MADKMINLKINGQSLAVVPGITIMAAAKQAGIFVPSLCSS